MLSARKWNFASSFPCFQKISTGLFSFLLLGHKKFKFLIKKTLFLYPRFTHPFEDVAERDNSHALIQSFCWMTRAAHNVNRLFPDVDATANPATPMFQLPKHDQGSEHCHQSWSSCGGHEMCKFYESRVTRNFTTPSKCKPFLSFPFGRCLFWLLGCISKATLSSSPCLN